MSARRPTSARPNPVRRSSSNERRTGETPRKKNDDLEYECKVAYLMVFEDVNDDITSLSQLRQALQQSGRNPSRRVLDKHWTEDTRALDFTDFVDICKRIPATSEDELMKAFKKIDLNGDGFISESEFTKMMTMRGEKLTREEIRKIIDEADSNKDGKLDYKEFARMVLSTQDECAKVAKQRYERRLQKADQSKGRSKHLQKTNENSSSAGKSDDTRSSQRNLSVEDIRQKADVPPTPRSSRSKVPTLELDSSSDSAYNEETPKDPPLSARPTSARSARRSNHSIITEANKAVPAQAKDDDDDSDDDIVIGSRVSLRKAEHQNVNGSQVSLRSSKSAVKTEHQNVNGSQVSLRSTKSSVKTEQHNPSGSQVSLRSSKSTSKNDSPGGTPPKPKPRKRSTVECLENNISDDVRASPRLKDRSSDRSSDRHKIPKPSNLDDWESLTYNGCFFVEEDGALASHRYQLSLTSDTSVWITIAPKPLSSYGDHHKQGSAATADTGLFLVRDKPDEDGNPVVRAFTEAADSKGKSYLRCDLDKGRYQILPFTSGCRLRQRHSQPSSHAKLVRKDGDGYTLTSDFKDKLGEIFDMCDLDGNRLLSREEFSMFNLRTSGEEIADEEWEVVRDNVGLKNEEVSLEGFIELNRMEAEENQGDTDDLWLTLSAMGYNKALVRDEATPFVMNIYAEDCEPHIKVLGLELLPGKVEKAVCQFTLNKGKMSKVRNMKDLQLFIWQNDHRGFVVLENKSRSTVTMKLDCSRSQNASTNRDHLNHTLTIKPKQTVAAHHMVPSQEHEDWNINCTDTVIKS